MSQENQNAAPEEEVGGYGTPTAEQEAGGQQFAQPREEEDFDAAGLNQNSPDGETFQTGTPNLSHFAEEDQDSSGEPGAGRFGGTDEQHHAENASSVAGFDPVPGESPLPRDPDASPGAGAEDGGGIGDDATTKPSTEAEPDAGNADDAAAGRFSSEPAEEASGIPDGSGNDLPKEKSPNDDDETFDAG
jgi:hypothetical protein